MNPTPTKRVTTRSRRFGAKAALAGSFALCLAVANQTANAQTDEADQLAYWPLDASTGSVAVDVAGTNDLTLVGGPSWQPTGGIALGTLDLDGGNDFGTIADGDLAAGFPGKNGSANDDFTIMAWINPDEVNDRQPIVSKQGTSAGGARRGYMFSAGTSSGDGRLYFEMFDGEGSGDKTAVTSNAPLATNAWQHVAVTYDFIGAGTSVLSLYVDGTLVGSSSTAVGPLQSNPQPLDVGRYFWSSGYSRHFDGQLDELRVLDGALDATEINALAVGSLPNVAPVADIALTPPVDVPPFTFVFDGNGSVDSDGSIVSYDWDLGDGTTATGPTVTHTYADEGIYSVSLTVTDNEGAIGIISANVLARLPGEGGDQIVQWSLDEAAGATAADSSGSNDMALSGNATFVPSPGGDGYLSFGGNSGYGSIADGALSGPMPSSSAEPLDDLSMTAWIRLDSANQRNPILSKQGTSAGGDRRGFLFTTGEGASAGRLSFEAFSNESTKTSIVAPTPLTSGTSAQWHHVAATYDYVSDGASVMRLYVDGVEVAADLTAVGPLQGNPQPLELGRYFWSSGYARYFDGDMDDVRIFDRALSAVDVADLVASRPVSPTAIFSATPETGAAPQTVSFDATASSDDGTIISYDWDFGDGTTATGVTADHTYTADGDYTVTLTVTDDELRTGTATTTIELSSTSPEELFVFEVDRLVTRADRGFPWNEPPMASANGDWTSPVDYANGVLHFRAEIKEGGQPVAKSMRLQFCVWQDNLTRETCGSMRTITGNPGQFVEWSEPISSMWKKNNVPIDWSRARQRYGIAIKNLAGNPVSDFIGWNWFGEDPDEWYPLDLRFTVVAVPAGETFGGWDTYVD